MSIQPRSIAVAATLCCLAGGLAAEDELYTGENISDIRLEGFLAPKSVDWSSNLGTGGSIEIDGEEDADRAFRFAVSSTTRKNLPVSLVLGGALAYTHLREDRSEDNDRFQSLTANFRIGAAFALGEMFHIEATPFIGAGGGMARVAGEDSDIGFVWEYGLQGGAFVTFSRAQIGFIAGWMHSEWDLEFDNSGSLGPDALDLELTHEGLYFGLSIGAAL